MLFLEYKTPLPQIINVDTLHPRRYNSWVLWSCMTSFRRGQHREVVGKSSVEKPDKHYLSQVIKIKINSDESYWLCVTLIWCDEIALYHYGLSPQTPNMKNVFRQILTEEHSAKYLTKNSSKLSVIKNKEILKELSQTPGT